MLKKLKIKIFIVVTTVNVLYSCNNNKEVRYEYYNSTEKIIKSEGEYLDGVLDGRLTYYFENGEKQEMSEWVRGVRNGLTIAYFPKGKVANEYSYVMGRLTEIKIYYESGGLKYVARVLNNNILYDSKNYDVSGNLLEMTPEFKVNLDTLLLGDTLRIIGSLSNVRNLKYKKGTMIIGSGFANSERGFLKDTLGISFSDSNFYSLSVVPKHRGQYKFVAQLGFLVDIDEKLNHRPIDSLIFFSSEGQVIVK